MGHVGIMWRGARSLLARYRMAKINLTLAPARGSRNSRREAKVARCSHRRGRRHAWSAASQVRQTWTGSREPTCVEGSFGLVLGFKTVKGSIDELI